MQEKTVRIDGLNIRYLEEGSGPPVLLLHGGTLGFSAEMWRRNMTPLARRGYRVLCYDQPGFGHSDPPPDFGLAYRQRFIDRFLAAMQIGRAPLVGHSQAGGLVVGAALEKPATYAGIVVLGTGSLLPPMTVGAGGRDVDLPVHEPSVEDTRALLKATLFDHALITPPVLAEYHAMSVGANFRHAVKRAEATAAQPKGAGKPLWQRLGEVAVPSLYIYGANDKGQAAARVGLARERYPKLDFRLLERCHHIVQWDRADEVERLIGDFLDGLKAAGDFDRPRSSLSHA